MKQWIMLALAVAAGNLSLAATKRTPKPRPQLVVSLADGSRLVGMTTVTSLPVRSEALGKMQIPLDKVRAVKFSPDHESIAVLFPNGDKPGAQAFDAALRNAIRTQAASKQFTFA